ncbi:RING-H2 finger protein ATL74 [Impatiens glandulifera]|uniref:RING-H2 finger protein ATL74 n=1 Tax=Impatiens glandulifera TaxID=253017 RepID=UPI001FB1456B|nr:RING-H2 finger protein ATL74 [Impatiens glandulifera]
MGLLLLHQHARRLLLDTRAPPGPPLTVTDGSRTRDSPTSREANFDTNMVIILAALLCALIGALGLNAIVRCALRCSRRFNLNPQNERLASKGLKKSELQQIPVAVYGASGAYIPATECPICLSEFAEGEKVRVLPICHHGFHMRCIDVWLTSHASCPTCRQSLLLPVNLSAGQGDASAAGDEID